MIAGEVRWMDDAASRIVAHYERHATSWDGDRRAAAWIEKPCIERFLGILAEGALARAVQSNT